MKPETKLVKPGEMTDELQDYKIIELERYTSKQFDILTKRQDDVIQGLEDIKRHMFDSQDKRIQDLEKRVHEIEKRHHKIDAEKKEKLQKRNEIKVWFNRTIAGAMITQIAGVIVMVLLLYFGIK